MRLTIRSHAVDGDARRGSVTTARGSFQTPVFMPVGTRGTIRAARTADIEELGAEIILANTYHLMLRPGADVVAELGGLHAFEGFGGHLLTDSGGYQVFSLSPKVDDDGATFRSSYDGSTHLLTPERAVALQESLGADIQMVLDVCSALPASRRDLAEAVDRTILWGRRALDSRRRLEDQSIFGICQGGTEPDLRAESARRTVELGFDGYGIGGLSVGESRDQMLDALGAAIVELPHDQPRYLMGVGDPLGIIEAVAAGVDMMDCVLPTRWGRHGTLLTDAGRVNAKRAEFTRSDRPLAPGCSCAVCARHSQGYVRHLLVVGEPTGATLCTLHNLAWMLDFMSRIRQAISEGTLDVMRRRVASVWSAPDDASEHGAGH